jgi:phosphoribosyl 1,2-cyclic phosphodiesterase/ActR/RegA family two-component response regulator
MSIFRSYAARCRAANVPPAISVREIDHVTAPGCFRRRDVVHMDNISWSSAPMRAYVIDDDPIILRLLTHLLKEAGHEVSSAQSSREALRDVLARQPDFILVDIMMPELDGLEFCRRVRAHGELAATKVIFVTAKSYDFDRRQGIAAGADGYITKPLGPDFSSQLAALLAPSVELRYWGVHGTLPVPGRENLRYGGNTSCVTMSFSQDRLFIFDAGSGIRALGSHLMEQKKRISAHIFISHPHWDHINAFPYFGPLFMQGNEFEIIGAAHGDISLRRMISDQMDSIYFPVTTREFGAHVSFREIGEQQLEVAGISVNSMLLCHPGQCLGYRVETGGRVLCYVTDNELFPSDLPQHNAHYRQQLLTFVEGADVLITDTTYMDEAYRGKVGWGHSAVGEVARLGHDAGVKELHLFHHDPDQTDDDIDRKLEAAGRLLSGWGSATKCVAPAEGDIVTIPLRPALIPAGTA